MTPLYPLILLEQGSIVNTLELRIQQVKDKLIPLI